MKSLTQVEFREREDFLIALARAPGTLESRLAALGVTPAGKARILRLAEQIDRLYVPAALADVSPRYRIGVGRHDERTSGEEIGRTERCTVLAWTT